MLKKHTTFFVQVILSLGFILAVLGYTAAVGHAMVSQELVLKVIQK